jgi:hypothetical protein
MACFTCSVPRAFVIGDRVTVSRWEMVMLRRELKGTVVQIGAPRTLREHTVKVLWDCRHRDQWWPVNALLNDPPAHAAPTPGGGTMSEREARVREIQARHDDFTARYSPGPDWEPFNQTHQDRGYLLAARQQDAERIKAIADKWDARMKDCAPDGTLAPVVALITGELRALLRLSEPGA